jgi:hypothetical protein
MQVSWYYYCSIRVSVEYRIAGNFCMVQQNFTFFADRLGTAKIIRENVISYMQSIDVGMVSTWRRREN